MKIDNRIKYTKQVIKKAFFQLLETAPVEKISVTKICQMAEINRATFYRYYESQYDLLSALENEMLDEITQSTEKYRNDIDKLTETIFIKFYERKETWTLLLSDHADLGFVPKIYAFFTSCFVGDNSTKERELRYHFLLYGYSGIFDYWVKNGMKEKPEEMSAYVCKFRHEFISGH